MATEEIFSMTPVGEIQVRTLPSAQWIVTETSGSYFEHSGSLFGRLFNFIRDNDISMTVPVEGDLSRAQMRFYLGKDATKDYADSGEVRVVAVPERTVVSIGAKGAYSEDNIDTARDSLEDWLKQQSDWEVNGSPYAVFWNGPMTLWLFKHFEVHIPIKPVDKTAS